MTPMIEKIVYLKDLDGLNVVCYVRTGFDEFRDNTWTYEAVVKGISRSEISIHYILSKELKVQKYRKTPQEIHGFIMIAVNKAKYRAKIVAQKLDEDSGKLETLSHDFRMDSLNV